MIENADKGTRNEKTEAAWRAERSGERENDDAKAR